MVTTMSPVPVGFVRYQNSASLFKNDPALWVSWAPPNVMETTWLLFASTPTRSSLLLPVPASKLASVIWYAERSRPSLSPDDDIVPELVLTPFSAMPGAVVEV